MTWYRISLFLFKTVLLCIKQRPTTQMGSQIIVNFSSYNFTGYMPESTIYKEAFHFNRVQVWYLLGSLHYCSLCEMTGWYFWQKFLWLSVHVFMFSHTLCRRSRVFKLKEIMYHIYSINVRYNRINRPME